MVRYDEAGSSWQELAVGFRSEGGSTRNSKDHRLRGVVSLVLMYTRSSSYKDVLQLFGLTDAAIAQRERFSSQARRVFRLRYFFSQLQSRCMGPRSEPRAMKFAGKEALRGEKQKSEILSVFWT